MSTQYITIPPIKFEDFLQGKSFKVQYPPKPVYLTEHRVITNNGSYLYVFKDENGNAKIERYGRNDINNVFPSIIEEFGVKVFDEYGLEFPNC